MRSDRNKKVRFLSINIVNKMKLEQNVSKT